MSKYNCYLCASDERMLLDIFGDAGKAFRGYIETCLSVKVKLSDAQSTKICHKCAYELESCEKFLAKCRHFSESLREGVASEGRRQCRLCGDTPKKLGLLQVERGNSRKNLLDKLDYVSLKDRNSPKENIGTFSICLDCRYNLDVLADLKTIYSQLVQKLRNVKENGQKLLDLPKIKTDVVTRKTTYIPEPKLFETSRCESDASSTSKNSSNTVTMPLKRKRVKTVKEPEKTERTSAVGFRKCEECETQVEFGIDMYRYHRSGQTVCKDCWLRMDPEKILNTKRKRLKSSEPESGTKLCAVFLKDILSNPSKYSNAYKVEKDKDGNQTFLITDESSESDEKDITRPRRLHPRATDSTSPAALETIPETRRAAKRGSSKESKMEQQTAKRGRPRRSDDSVETSPVPVKTTRERNDLAVEAESTIKTRSRRSSSESTTVSTSLSLETAKKNPPSRKSTRTTKNSSSKKPSTDEKSFESGSSSNESRVPSERAKTIPENKKEKTTVTKNEIQRSGRRARSNSFTDSDNVISNDEPHLDGNSSEDSSVPLNSRKVKATAKPAKTRGKNAKSDSELDKPYTCSICLLTCKNALVGKAHELAHEKQPKVELRRVIVAATSATPEINVEETPPELPITEVEEEAEEGKNKEDSQDEKNEDAATAENPEQPMPVTEKPETENIATPDEPASQEKPESSLVREEPEDERTMKQNLDDEKKNKEEIQVPVEKETETIEEAPKPVDKDESLVQETKTDRNENNENKENDNSEEKLNKDKDDEANDRVEEPSLESKEPCEVETEPPEVPTPRQDEPDGAMDVTSTKETEKTTQNEETARTLEAPEPMEVTETEAEEKSVEKKEDLVDDVEKAEKESCEKDSNGTEAENEEKSEQQPIEVEVPAAKTASETEETLEVLEVGEECAKDEAKENDEEKQKDQEESSENHKEEEAPEKLIERDEEEKEAAKSTEAEDEKVEKAEERLDSSKGEKDEEVSLVVEESKEDEQPIQQSEEKDEEKNEENTEMKRIPEADEPSNELSIATSETLREVFDLASAEVQKRLENDSANKDATAETLENISMEIQSGSDMPSLELEAVSNEKS